MVSVLQRYHPAEEDGVDRHSSAPKKQQTQDPALTSRCTATLQSMSLCQQGFYTHQTTFSHVIIDRLIHRGDCRRVVTIEGIVGLGTSRFANSAAPQYVKSTEVQY